MRRRGLALHSDGHPQATDLPRLLDLGPLTIGTDFSSEPDRTIVMAFRPMSTLEIVQAQDFESLDASAPCEQFARHRERLVRAAVGAVVLSEDGAAVEFAHWGPVEPVEPTAITFNDKKPGDA
jgi:hypothetical protein